jgi:hypothetical protein
MAAANNDCCVVAHCEFKPARLRHTDQRLEIAHEQLACRLWRGLLLATFLNIQSGLFYDLLSNFMGKGDKVRRRLTACASPVQIQLMSQRAGFTGRVTAACWGTTMYVEPAHSWTSVRQETFPYAFRAADASYSLIATSAGSVGVTKCACFGVVCCTHLLHLENTTNMEVREYRLCFTGCTATSTSGTAGTSSQATPWCNTMTRVRTCADDMLCNQAVLCMRAAVHRFLSIAA